MKHNYSIFHQKQIMYLIFQQKNPIHRGEWDFKFYKCLILISIRPNYAR